MCNSYKNLTPENKFKVWEIFFILLGVAVAIWIGAVQNRISRQAYYFNFFPSLYGEIGDGALEIKNTGKSDLYLIGTSLNDGPLICRTETGEGDTYSEELGGKVIPPDERFYLDMKKSIEPLAINDHKDKKDSSEEKVMLYIFLTDRLGKKYKIPTALYYEIYSGSILNRRSLFYRPIPIYDFPCDEGLTSAEANRTSVDVLK